MGIQSVLLISSGFAELAMATFNAYAAYSPSDAVTALGLSPDCVSALYGGFII